MSHPGAVVIGGYVNGLGLVRALAARGVPTAVITTKPYDIAHRSRWVTRHDAIANLEDQPDSLVELLHRRASDWAGWALFPTNDEALSALTQHETALSSIYKPIIPSADATRYLLDKSLMNGVAAAIGTELPRCYGPASEEVAESPDLQFPVVVKPAVSFKFFARFGSKLFVAHDRRQLRSCIHRVADARIAAHVAEFIPGSDDSVYAYCLYVNRQGDPLPGVTVRKIRQSPPTFGVARVAEVVAENPVMREIIVEIARRIGLRGMAVAEFKRDARDGRFRFIELNGRSVVYNTLLRKAGVNLAGLAWSDYVLGTSERPQPREWRGTWVNLHADLLYSVLHPVHRVAVSDFFHPYRRRIIDAVWSPRDPAPSLWQWSQTASVAARALWRGTYRELIDDRVFQPHLWKVHRPIARALRDSTARNFLPS